MLMLLSHEVALHSLYYPPLTSNDFAVKQNILMCKFN